MQGVAAALKPFARPDAALRRVGSEWVLFDAGHDRAHVLNLTSAIIWTYCDGHHEPAAIARAIALDLPLADAAAIRHDIEDVLDRFAAEGLLR